MNSMSKCRRIIDDQVCGGTLVVSGLCERCHTWRCDHQVLLTEECKDCKSLLKRFRRKAAASTTTAIISNFKCDLPTRPLVTIDQQKAPANADEYGAILVMSLDGVVSQPFDPSKIPPGAVLVGDVNCFGVRNERSHSQQFLIVEERVAFIEQLSARGIRVRSVENVVAKTAREYCGLTDQDKDKDAMALYKYLKARPEVLISGTRPVEPYPPVVDNTAALAVERDFRKYETYRPASLLARMQASIQGADETVVRELDLLKNDRVLAAIYLSFFDMEGVPRGYSVRFIMKKVMKLHGRARLCFGAGNSMRAVLRNVGNGTKPEKLNEIDRYIRTILRYFENRSEE